MSGLAKKNILIKTKRVISRLVDDSPEINLPKKLNTAQQNALEQLRNFNHNKPVSLIYGVTSSGKTEIYIHRMLDVIKEGKQVLYLLPEIALTEQIINRLRFVFGNKVGVYHSKYSDSERVEVWNDINLPDGRFTVILGARSSLFLPFSNLGLIIIDEEHETSFKQHDPAPRYHARDAAIILGHIHEAQVVMGTATPALETYFNAKSGKFNLIELTERYSKVPLPEIIVANAREAHRKKMIRGHFTPELLEAIDQALINNEQIILFQNRRGYSPYIECDTCGYIPKCRDCDVSLTLHKYRNRLVCHYCGASESVPTQCPSCHNNSMRTQGLGTERLEDEIAIIFPNARLARLDLDAARSKKGYSRILEEFEDGKTDILIGTQMVTKGLDFSRVRVVGIINADNLLHFPDFRSFERGFQLMTQVSGRAGRKKERGIVIIQTFDPQHRVIKQVQTNDYSGLYSNEMLERRSFGYPPFTRLIGITFKHKDQDMVARCAHIFAKELRKTWTTRILGPQTPPIARIQQYYIRKILIKSAKGHELAQMRSSIKELIMRIKNDKVFRSVVIQPDVDPV
ncbi:MAG: primosomal protein N' [Bacteroidales bacterium]|nr:primosomal protein N' [Bacteroidales bacterium]